jgi:hypothetical protein
MLITIPFYFLGKQNGATILELKRHSQLSKLKKNNAKYIQNLLTLDEARATSIQNQIKNLQERNAEFSSEAAQLPLSSGIKLQTLNYVTTITIGSTSTTVIVDTGSDLTWVSYLLNICYYMNQ